MSIKTITMTCSDQRGGYVTLKQNYDEDCPWDAIAFQFYKFLASQSYVLDHEKVGADIELFVKSTTNEEVF